MDEKTLHYDTAESELAKEELKSSATSISSGSTVIEKPLDAGSSDGCALKPGRSFFVDARGIGMIRFPVPSSQLEIPIQHSDGSLAYTSTKEKRWCSNSVLSSPKLGALMTTTYFVGPNRNPIIQLPHPASGEDPQDVTLSGKWTSRRQTFKTLDGAEFEWRYVRQQGKRGTKLLVLEKKEDTSSGSGRRLAQLVRNEDTRPEGTRATTAGNGGELVLDQDAHLELDEALIMATCLVMLKKEMDRRRIIQMIVISSGASGS